MLTVLRGKKAWKLKKKKKMGDLICVLFELCYRKNLKQRSLTIQRFLNFIDTLEIATL